MIHNDVFQRNVAKLSKESVVHSKLAFDISDRIADILEEKGLSQRDLAKALNKSESEVSKWLGGTQNFTLKTLSKISAFLGEPLVVVPAKFRN